MVALIIEINLTSIGKGEYPNIVCSELNEIAVTDSDAELIFALSL